MPREDVSADAPLGEAPDGAQADTQGVNPGKEAAGTLDPVAELTEHVQRLQAEFSNYRKRVERDREQVRESVIASTLGEFLAILDDIGRARAHSELEGGFKSVGEALESTVGRLGMRRFGDPGDEFDPLRHEAIAHEYSSDVTTSTCMAVFQPGYEFAGRVIRPAIVSVADPADSDAAGSDSSNQDS
ncbi:MAG: nucleotide exchange factor GrpE [Actinobacteria bacterium]|nr:nucleotide exchange factor GrpE [Actinomycetota bacterium]